MANPGILIALCAALLAVDGSAQPVSAIEAPVAPACKFTLERDAGPVADDETWQITCHRQAPAPAPAQPTEPVVQRRVVKPGGTAATAL